MLLKMRILGKAMFSTDREEKEGKGWRKVGDGG